MRRNSHIITLLVVLSTVGVSIFPLILTFDNLLDNLYVKGSIALITGYIIYIFIKSDIKDSIDNLKLKNNPNEIPHNISAPTVENINDHPKIVIINESPEINDFVSIDLKKCFDRIIFYINNNVDFFKEDLLNMKEQISRYNYKYNTVINTLNNKFNPNEMTVIKITNIINSIEKLIVKIIQSTMTRLESFNEAEYVKLINKAESKRKNSQVDIQRKAIFQEYTNFVSTSIEHIEILLLKLDTFQLELNKIDNFNDLELDKLDEIINLDNMISSMKYYR
ncbi:MAG: hypothetical protein LBT38_07695 [Deltaproteobacteria bacterium]|nr:hypothetical protein [Deltaproteobacteria bacterium]